MTWHQLTQHKAFFLPCPMLLEIWRWLLGTINCFGSCAINSSVTWNPSALPIGHKMNFINVQKSNHQATVSPIPSVFTAESIMFSSTGTLHWKRNRIKEFRCYGMEIEKPGRRQDLNPGQLWLEPLVLCHWATTARQPPVLTNPLYACIALTVRAGGCPVSRLSSRALAARARCPGFDSRQLLAFSLPLITSKFLYFQLEARCSEREQSSLVSRI